MTTVTAVLGSITEQHVDAIVNAANYRMRGGGGVDGAIHRAGGRSILEECIARFPDGLATGDAGFTTAGDLPAKWVIHTPGPNYGRGQNDPELLASCYRRSMEVASELGAQSVAFPLLSSGIYRWPIEDAIKIAVHTLSQVKSDVSEVRLVTIDAAVHVLLQSALVAA
ncbi:O-acetyl-ADP-ribose deacetylase [Leucobacter sp. cx-328]|uniref:O-acetyl-ADP-ribose deacetylase n=1 Tax=unclassified Leucobacter TaxID=2621730 RepID=UPI00165E3D8D|nr:MULTISPECIES: O-acetyl-ADP-ribose deacetylase [unclassified Leucobacter]MBC9943982.1 O-acetyl-ADP-ribose deacetylase [Leucobacter sp. cx-328]